MANGMGMRILATFMDSGGHFSESVYKECARRGGRRMWAIKGEGGEGKPYVRLMKKGNLPDKAVGFIIAVDGGKEAILYSSGIEEPGARYMHFPLDNRCGYDLEFFRGLISEKQIIRRKKGQNVIEWEKTYERNEPLDCRNYARAAYKYFNWQFEKIEKALRGELEEKVSTRQEAERKKQWRVVSRGIKV